MPHYLLKYIFFQFHNLPSFTSHSSAYRLLITSQHQGHHHLWPSVSNQRNPFAQARAFNILHPSKACLLLLMASFFLAFPPHICSQESWNQPPTYSLSPLTPLFAGSLNVAIAMCSFLLPPCCLWMISPTSLLNLSPVTVWLLHLKFSCIFFFFLF